MELYNIIKKKYNVGRFKVTVLEKPEINNKIKLKKKK